MNQVSIQFDKKQSRARRDDGIKRAVDKADTVHNQWSEKALDFLRGYAEINPKFMIEDVRYASQGVVPSPPSQRSWGAIVLKALRAGWIYKVPGEIQQVRNAKAHMANAQVWRSNIVKH